MDIKTGWVKPAYESKGLDHIGAQAPCINLYGQLLPGITNVTDRARYYSFYPWFLWAYDKRNKKKNVDDFRIKFRRADVLFTLIAGRHEEKCIATIDRGAHGLRMVGRDSLMKIIRGKGGKRKIKLSDYSSIDAEEGKRYFGNKFGGLGQYYRGTLHELGLTASHDIVDVIGYIKETGDEIAEEVEKGIDSDLFFKIITKNYVTFDEIDQLVAFCPCKLSKSKGEHNFLIDLFFCRKDEYEQKGIQRKYSLALLLHYLKQIQQDQPEPLDKLIFLCSAYSGVLPDGEKWAIPDVLEETREGWAVYLRNELLSIAAQAIYAASLILINQKRNLIFYGASDFIDYIRKLTFLDDVLLKQKNMTFKNALMNKSKKIVKNCDYDDKNHEMQLAQLIADTFKQDEEYTDPKMLIKNGIEIILSIAIRDDNNRPAYGSFILPHNYINEYPINLISFRNKIKDTWGNMPLKEVLLWIMSQWGIDLHLRVALRKLRYNLNDTFTVQPTEKGLKVKLIPPPVFTNPRFRQAKQILRDIGAISSNNGENFQLTKLGDKLLKEING